MKKVCYRALLLVFLLLFSACGGTSVLPVDDTPTDDSSANSIPQTVSAYDANAAGGGIYEYSQPCAEAFDSISIDLINLVGTERFEEWAAALPKFYNNEPFDGLSDYVNIYSFVTRFGVDKTDVLGVIDNLRAAKQSYEYLTGDDVDAIYSFDEAQLISRFKSEYTIYHGGKLFTPKWIFTHGEADYLSYKIPSEKITRAKEAFRELLSERTAADALLTVNQNKD